MFVRSALLSLSALAAAREVSKDTVKAAKLYDSGIKHMNNIALKEVRADNILSELHTNAIVGSLGRATRVWRL
jgi:hypothetical protein